MVLHVLEMCICYNHIQLVIIHVSIRPWVIVIYVIVFFTNIQVIVIDGTEHNVIIIESNVIVTELLLFYYNCIFKSHIKINFY